MPNKIPIYTIQFLDIPFSERRQHLDAERHLFLDCITKNIFEKALKKQSNFKKVNCDAEYFHTDKNYSNKVPKLINCIIKDDALTIRAYTKKAVKTLKFWYKKYKKEHPGNCINIRFSKETYQFKIDNKLTHHYSSTNWIAFDNLSRKNKQYYFNNKLVDFEDKLKGNIGEFLDHLEIPYDYKMLKIKLDKTPNSHKTIIALKSKIEPVKQWSFKINFSSNYVLPQLFSLGRKKAYGNGVFTKDYTKTKYHETSKINLKPN